MITPDTIVSLSPGGREFVNTLLAAASAEAGRTISGEDFLEVLRRVRAELGADDPDFTISEHMECLKRTLRAIGKEPPGPKADRKN